MSILRAGDVISGQAGRATANISGNIEDMYYVKSLEATLDKRKVAVKALGSRNEQQKTAGWSGSGTMTIHYMTSLFRQQALNYVKNGIDTNFTVTVINDDESSTVGKQTIVLYNVNINSLTIAKLDTESDDLEETIDFTYDNFDILDEFGSPVI